MPTEDKPIKPPEPRPHARRPSFRRRWRRLSEWPERVSWALGGLWDRLAHGLGLRAGARWLKHAAARTGEAIGSLVRTCFSVLWKRTGLKTGARRVAHAADAGSEKMAEKTSLWQEQLVRYTGLGWLWRKTARLRAWFEATAGVWLEENLIRPLARTWLGRWAKAHKRWSAATLISLGLLAIWSTWFGLPAYQLHKADRFSTLARRQLEARDLRKAIFLARKALSLYPRHAEGARVIADVAATNASPAALVWYQRVVLVQPATSNRLALALAALRFEPPPFALARRTLEEIDPAGQRTAAYQRALAELALRQSNLQEAGSRFEQALALQPADDLSRLALATLRLASKDTNLIAHAKLTLEQLARDPDLGPAACRALVRANLAARDYASALHHSARVLAFPKASFSDRLEHLSLLQATTNRQFAPFLAALQRQAAASPDETALLVGWMATPEHAAPALAWVKTLPASLQTNLSVVVATAGAHAVRKDWAGLALSLQAQDWGVVDFLRAAMLSRALQHLGRAPEAAAEWRRALDIATRQDSLLTFYRTLSNWGWTQEADQTLWQVAEGQPTETWPTRLLLRSYQRQGNTPGLYRVNLLLHQRSPGDLPTKNNLATLSLLLRTNLSLGHRLAREVYDAKPQDARFVSTYAFSLHLQGKTREGLQRLGALPPSALDEPGTATYYGLLLAAVGDKARSKPYLERALTDRLLPEEKRLVTKAAAP